ncbi:Iron-sulfur flavoprotein [Rhodovulum sp. PH10]|uniref:NAD(P)H-dependent oxidoreductase n=1 Tax=Rhodovulum sp. PH10 TaxID=1187851 RepID=UPI00027C27D1|nr:NAD(P)H-dependent oxidoreductase [Rhodovulum sp. PH10]EJW11318.1 Iron-sulfur flavoprotein [Rhodovulum sp. PH10]
MMRRPKLLGIAASLRNARWGAGNRLLVEALTALPDRPALDTFLATQSELHLENFVQAGRRDGKGFVEIYRNLKKSKGETGLSNSEVALAAALWAAHRAGAEVAHLSLAEHFGAGGGVRDRDALCAKLREADGLLVSGPVYFGDRGSLAESLITLIATDAGLRDALAGRPYGGISVGAKRNGGQETTLIYQMLDMLGLGLIAVGNDSETTAQYGGTGHAGDVGTMHRDRYGIDTAMGVGRRMARVLETLASGGRLAGPPRVLFLVLQDTVDGAARRSVEALVARLGSAVAATVVDVVDRHLDRCIACDICPTGIDVDAVYRCVITSGRDAMAELHPLLLHHDALVPVVAVPRDRARIVGGYQTFVERSRYLRRGDYVWSDLVVAPLCLAEAIGADTHAIRMMTSFLRHHTIMTKPLVGRLVDGALVDAGEIVGDLSAFAAVASRVAAGRLAAMRTEEARYMPVGYVLSAQKESEDAAAQRRRGMIEDRIDRLRQDARARLRHDAASAEPG